MNTQRYIFKNKKIQKMKDVIGEYIGPSRPAGTDYPDSNAVLEAIVQKIEKLTQQAKAEGRKIICISYETSVENICSGGYQGSFIFVSKEKKKKKKDPKTLVFKQN